MRKRFLSAALILALLFLAVAGTLFNNLSWADPYVYRGEVPPKPSTIPPQISISSPKNNTVYNTNYIALNFYVNPPTGPTVNSPIVTQIYYKADWKQNQVTIYNYTGDPYSELTTYSVNLNLTGIPAGNHSITVVAGYHGWYIPGVDPHYAQSENGFSIGGSSVVNFTIRDLTPPKISFLSPVNQTYNETSVPLVFTVDKTVNWAGYSLDGQQNVAIRGNTTIYNFMVSNFTLANMTNGLHSVAVYANDTFGIIGSSETVNFTVALAPKNSESFPTATVAAVSGASAVAVVGAGLLVYFKKRKH